MRKRTICFFCAACLCLTVLSGCGGNPRSATPPSGSAAPEASRLKVVTTIFPPYDFVREIAGNDVELTMLLSPGAESHSYDPSPQDIIAIGNSDLFLYTGGGSDLWVDRILESMDTDDMTILALSDITGTVGEEIVEGMEHGHDDGHHGDEDHDHDHEGDGEMDEHVWTSPANAALIVQALTDTLCRLDSVHADAWRKNADAFLLELEALDSAFRELTDSAARRTLVFGDRFPFRYFTDAYGLEYFAAFPGCSTDTEASAATVAFLIDKVREEELPVVFHIELSNQRMADAICEATGAEKRLLHSVHNVTAADFASGTGYLELMTQNLENLREALL